MLGEEDGDATPARRRSREEEEGDGGRGVVSVGVDGRWGRGGADEVVLGCGVLRSQGDDDDWGGPSVEGSTARAAR